MKCNKYVLSNGNKKRNDHKHVQEKHVEKVKEKIQKRPKKAKNNIEYMSSKIMNKEKLKTVRKEIIKNLIPRKPYIDYKYEDDCRTCLGIGCKYCRIEEVGKDNDQSPN